ncbi:MAG: type I DNA topoisomerase [Actinomycetaceae bacterium]|nr:type I DNA topoisomerase [Actinomycetaceae bacterium]
MTAKKLVIVESPAKAKTIGNYLGSDFQVEASIGHIRDLPRPSDLPASMKKGPYAKFAVNVDDNFKPYYVVNSDKKKTVSALKKALKEADELYLATDEDREGEAIAWHLAQVLQPKIPVKRMVFHEITRDAIARALEETRDIDLNLVDAQETRRILDRLVGYEVSPLLWRKVRAGLSAGRVQSVATRMVVERERERMRFVPATFFDLHALFSPTGTSDDAQAFSSRAIGIDGQRFAQGRDFDDDGNLKKPELIVMDRSLCDTLKNGITSAQPDTFTVSSVDTKPYKRRPAPPFTTSTLQQEAGRKLRMSSRETMQVAQRLYENGFITYMRTDSTALSAQAIDAARTQATQLFGSSSVPDTPRIYSKKVKGAQEAHEAIRPAGAQFKTPEQVAASLGGPEAKLYELVWKRTLASQMTDATGSTDTVRIEGRIAVDHAFASCADGTVLLELRASGTVITHQGFMAAYQESTDAQRYAHAEDNKRLPQLLRGDALTCVGLSDKDNEHTTTPPPRYTEASLVRAMEEKGIGRPSTYASTIGVIIDRGYVQRRAQALIPSWLAFSVTRLLEDNLADLVDYDFTAELEADLDKIAQGEQDGPRWLASFYLGKDSAGKGLAHLVESLGDIDARAVNSIALTDDMTIRVGRYGPYLEKADGSRASVPDGLAPDELNAEVATQLFEHSSDTGRELGVDPSSGNMIITKTGRYGPYVTEVLPEEADPEESTEGKKKKKVKPRTASLFKTMDMATVTLEDALRLLSLPREVGVDPETGDTITAQNGPYGPYLKKGSDLRSLDSEEQLFSVTLDQALAIYAQPKVRGRRAAKPPLKEFGNDPISAKPVVIKDGRFGPYITDGQTNVTVPRSRSIDDISADEAFQLLSDKRAKGPAKKRTTKKVAAKKSGTKKTTVKKTTAKKTTTKK